MKSSRRPEERLSLRGRIGNRLLVATLDWAIRLADRAGVDRTLRFGAAFGRVWHALRGPRTRRVREQLAEAFPECQSGELRRIEAEVFEHLGQGLAELLLMLGRHRATLLDAMDIVGLEHLERAVADADGKGAVVIGPHLGNWELGAAKLASIGVPVSAVYRGLRQPALERAVVEVRAGRGRDQSPRGDEDRAIQQIAMGRSAGVHFVRALEAGRSVLVLLDQHARRDEGIEVDFFARPASTRFGPLKLASRTGAPVLLAFTRREEGGRRHTLTFHPAIDLEPGGHQEEQVLRRNLQRVTREIEKQIRISPEQWIWTHRRWRAAGVGGRRAD